MEGQVQYKTDELVPVYWYHYTPDALVVPESSPIKSFQDFVAAAKKDPEKLSLGGSGLNSANHAAHVRLNGVFGISIVGQAIAFPKGSRISSPTPSQSSQSNGRNQELFHMFFLNLPALFHFSVLVDQVSG